MTLIFDDIDVTESLSNVVQSCTLPFELVPLPPPPPAPSNGLHHCLFIIHCMSESLFADTLFWCYKAQNNLCCLKTLISLPCSVGLAPKFTLLSPVHQSAHRLEARNYVASSVHKICPGPNLERQPRLPLPHLGPSPRQGRGLYNLSPLPLNSIASRHPNWMHGSKCTAAA